MVATDPIAGQGRCLITPTPNTLTRCHPISLPISMCFASADIGVQAVGRAGAEIE